MEKIKLKEAVISLFKQNRSSNDILQNFSKHEIEQVQETLIGVGYNLVTKEVEKLEKKWDYKIPGVTSAGHIPLDHPERQAAVEHINKLMAYSANLPEGHKHKDITRNLANMLYEKHIGGDKVIKPEPKAVEPKKPLAPSTINYAEMNKPATKEPTGTIDYSGGEPVYTPAKK